MAGAPMVLEYGPTRPVRRRRWPWIWLTIAGLILFLLAISPSPGWQTWIDVNSGDLMTKRSIGGFCYSTRIERTPFSNAIRKYVGVPAPAKWVYCFGKVGTFNAAYEDGAEGYWPSECLMMMKTIDLVRPTDAEMKALMTRCAGYLANDQRQAIEDEMNRLIDRATTRP